MTSELSFTASPSTCFPGFQTYSPRCRLEFVSSFATLANRSLNQLNTSNVNLSTKYKLSGVKKGIVGCLDLLLPSGATEEDARHMRRAVELSRTALGKTSPNPMVGCVIVKDGRTVGEGFHPKAGQPHAEVFALREAGKEAFGATAYVSLEPCNHYGRTPPCSQALVKARVKKVVVGTTDPNPLVAGKGIQTLRNAGIEVIVGVEEELCKKNVEAFVCRMMEKRPFVTLRYNMSTDGKLLGSTDTSEVESGSYYSKLLAESDAVVVMAESLLVNPLLLSSEENCQQPIRVVIASGSLDINRSAFVFDPKSAPTLVVATEKALADDIEKSIAESKVSSHSWLLERGVEVVIVNEIDLDNVLSMCYQRNASSVLLDDIGGAESSEDFWLLRTALEQKVVDKVHVVVSPVLVGKEGKYFEAELEGGRVRLERVGSYKAGQNIVVESYPIFE